MNAIRTSLLHDHNIDLSERNMQCKVWREVKDRVPFYVEFTVSKTQDEVLHDVNKYLRSYGENYKCIFLFQEFGLSETST